MPSYSFDTKIKEALRLLYSAQNEMTELSDMQEAEELHGQDCPEDISDQVEKIEEVIDLLEGIG